MEFIAFTIGLIIGAIATTIFRGKEFTFHVKHTTTLQKVGFTEADENQAKYDDNNKKIEDAVGQALGVVNDILYGGGDDE